MRTRFREPTGGVPWRWPVLVHCPRCDARATVANTPGTPTRLTCPACALVREWTGEALLVGGADGEAVQLHRSRVTGSWLDPDTGGQWPSDDLGWPAGRDECFGAALWLTSECCGGRLLWARNADHLEYLRSFVAGELREVDPSAVGRPISSKLPAWLQEAKHRDEVLRHLDRLRRTLD